MITENTKAILLLTSYFNSNEVRECSPLPINQYGYFACWLNQNNYKPLDLLQEESFDTIWGLWDEPLSHIKSKSIIDFKALDSSIAKITYDRIKSLLNRGASLSLALDKWQSAGVWIMDRQHEHYPKAIKKQLKHQSPALLFGVGNPELLSKQAIGFVGSRDCNTDDEQATNHYVEQINQLNYQVVSGGAKGVDTHSMLASLNNGNTAIGILADSLFRSSASSQWRQHLKANNLVLISPFFPEGRFTPANAMVRNKFIYLLSNATVVVTSGEKGGTWEGAKENLKKDWVPLLISTHQEPLKAGNQALINGIGLLKGSVQAQTVSPTLSTEKISALILGTSQPESEDFSVQIKPETIAQNDMFSNEHTDDQIAPSEDKNDSFLDGLSFQEGEPSAESVETEKYINDNPDNILPNVEEHAEAIPESETQEQVSQISTTPLLDQFHQQLSALIEKQPQQIIDKSVVENNFPEFEIIGKTALDKWLKHLVEEQKLVKPHARKNQYTLPKRVEY